LRLLTNFYKIMAIGDAPLSVRPALVPAASERRVHLAARHSLTPRTACIFVATVGATTFAVAAPFAWHGFWPVLFYAAAEIAVLIWAVHESMRDGLEHETITIVQDYVTIVHRGRYGERSSVFPRHWSRVTLHAPPAALHPSRLLIESHGRACEVGRFLTEDERRSLAVRLKQLVGNVNESPAL
jgi:uncharacterized membrane protein